jgi:2-methylcitrate dehydratase PrpD
MNITEQLAAFSADISVKSLPPEVVARARQLILDLAGSMVRGRQGNDSTPALLSAVKALGLTSGAARVFGDKSTYSPAGAALINATTAHSLDFDDTHAAGTLHPGAPVIPAALAAAEMTGASGADVIAGVVAGYEVICRTALALPAGDHYQRGYHPSATCGVFGAAAAAGRVFGLDAARISSAFGIALSQSAGSLQFLANGAWTKRFQVGWASMAGLTAATLAREGFKGASDAIDGRHGFLATYAPTPTPARAVQDLGRVYELMATAVKPYPSCRYGHAGIDAVLSLRAEHQLKAEEVDSITYGLSKAGMMLVGAPAEKKANPCNVVDGQFSAPFVLSVALATGQMNWDSYDLLDDPRIRSFFPKVQCQHDPEIEAEFPTNMSGKIAIAARGTTFTKKVVVPKGEPSNFFTDDELQRKFMQLSEPVMGKNAADDLADTILKMDTIADINDLMRRASVSYSATTI